jgi:hypothetical protein
MADNLLEARIAQHELAALIGPAGLPMPTRATLRQHLRNGALIDMHLTTCVTALESSCDCLAALAIGVLRIPLPLKTAQFSQFNNLPNLVPLTPDLVRAWDDWQKLLDHHSTTPPAGWREWVTGMRNLHVHRARQGRVMLERRRKPGPPILVPERSAQEALQSVTRFDLHLRRRPHLADMEDLVLAPGLSDF